MSRRWMSVFVNTATLHTFALTLSTCLDVRLRRVHHPSLPDLQVKRPANQSNRWPKRIDKTFKTQISSPLTCWCPLKHLCVMQHWVQLQLRHTCGWLGHSINLTLAGRPAWEHEVWQALYAFRKLGRGTYCNNAWREVVGIDGPVQGIPRRARSFRVKRFAQERKHLFVLPL